MIKLLPNAGWVAAAMLLLSGSTSGEDRPRAAELRTDGRPSPARVFPEGDPRPQLSWTFQGAAGTRQQAYQVEVREGSLGAAPGGLGVLSGYNPEALKEKDVCREDIADKRHERIRENGQASEVGFWWCRAPGKSHTYAWRVRLHDGARWGPWSEWQRFTANQIPFSPRALHVRNSKTGEQPGEIVPSKPVPRGRTIEVQGGENLVQAVGVMKSGDTCVIAPGAYRGDLRVCTPFVTLRAAEGAEGKVSIEGKVRLDDPEGAVLDGLLIRGDLIVRGHKNVVRNCSVFGHTGVWGSDTRFWNCRFLGHEGHDTFEASGRGIEVIGCRVKARGSGLRSGRPAVGCIFTENVVWGADSTGGLKTYDGQNVRWSYNVIYDCTRGIQIYRTAHNELYNNVFHNCTNAVFGGAPGTHELICNNVFANCGGVVMTPDCREVVVKHNGFFNIRGNRLGVLRWSSQYPQPFTEQQKTEFKKQIYGDARPNISADPAFADVAEHDYRPSRKTALVDAGDPSFPVPVGGDERVDIGRYEWGAEFPYTDWQPKWTVTDPQPTITWKFADWDEEDMQGAFQVQLDTSCYFDTENLLDSGKIAGGASTWRVSRPLKPGKYYFRIRVADDKQAEIFGLWSDRHYCLEAVANTAR